MAGEARKTDEIFHAGFARAGAASDPRLDGLEQNRVQGFIAPGHVCTVMGCREYESLVRDFRVPIVVGGFEPVDILEAVLMLVRQLEGGERGLENQYVRR